MTAPAPTARPTAGRRLGRLAVSVLLLLICLAMARLQWWRAETRGAEYERQRAQAQAASVALDPAQRDAAPLTWRLVSAEGRYLADQTIFLDNKVYHQRPGYQVLTPLRLAGTQTVVLVNRGWIPAPRLRSETPTISTPEGNVRISGIARPFPDRSFTLGNTQPQGRLWQQVRADDFRRHSGLDPLPVIVLQQDSVNDGLVRDWSEVGGPENPAQRHQGYALMWLLFSLMALIYGAIVWRRSDDDIPPTSR